MERAHKRIARRTPREASRPGRGRRSPKGARKHPSFGRFTSPSSQKRGLRARFVQTATLAQVCRPLRRKVLRSVGRRYRLATVAWVLHDWRGNTFRFVVCRNSIQGTMALQLRVSNHQRQPDDGSSIARSGESAGGGESSARSGRRQSARRTTGRRAFSSVSNHGGGSIEVV